MDGTHSEGLSSFLANLPRGSTTRLWNQNAANGNKVADGKLMVGLQTQEHRRGIAIAAFYRD